MENKPKLVVFVRHAESERNQMKKGAIYFADDTARRITGGRSDENINLTPRGHGQAEQTGVVIREKFGVFDTVYHSGFNRTSQTMEGILKAYSTEEKAMIKIQMNPFIYERHPGYTYDMTKEEAEAEFPWLDSYWKTFGGYFAQPPGGESLAQVTQRVYAFFDMLRRDRPGQNIMVVTHGNYLLCVRLFLEQLDFEQVKAWPADQTPQNCGVTSYRLDEVSNRLILQEYNSVFWK